MSDIVLTAGVRQNLLALQNTATLMSITQNRLATGKKINSALDNPNSYFTAQSLNVRATDLNSLLDSIGQAQQTLKAADNGITALTNLAQSAKSIATQALQAPRGTVSYTNITGNNALAPDVTRIAASGDFGADGLTSVQSISTFSFANTASMVDGDSITVSLNGVNRTYTWKSVAPGAGEFNDANTLRALVAADFGAVASVSAVSGGATGTFTMTSNDLTHDATVSATRTGAGTVVASAAAHTLGDALIVSDGTNTQTFYRVANNAQASANTYADETDLDNLINNSAIGTGGGGHISATTVGTGIQLDRADGGNIILSGAMSNAVGYTPSASAVTFASNYNASLATLAGDVTVQIGTNNTHTLTFGGGSNQIHTRTALAAALTAFTDITGSIDSTGHFNLAPSSSDNVTVGGSALVLTALGVSAGTITPQATVITPNATRANLEQQYNDMLLQIDQLAKDASYNGVNLIYGDDLKVMFNENGSSSLTITGVKFDSKGIGLNPVAADGFQDNKVVSDVIAAIDGSLTALRAQASKFGSNLTTVQARQDFAKNLVNTLQTGADNLVLADTNEEGANMLALQTRQQLSTTALSLANQASQAVLRLFG